MLIHLLACYGLTFILCDSEILEGLRFALYRRSVSFWQKFLGCHFCAGFWMSALIMAVVNYGLPVPAYLVEVVVGALAGATFTFALNTALLALEAMLHDRDPPTH